MPTSARLAAAVLLAAIGFFAAELVKPYLPPEQPVGLFSPIATAFGLLIGWVYTGSRLQAGVGTSAGIGIASVALLVFWVTLSFSGYDMVKRSMRLYYDGPTEALQDMVSIAMGYLVVAAKADVIIALVVGGVVTGILTSMVARRFR